MSTPIQSLLGLPADFPVEDATEDFDIWVKRLHVRLGKPKSPDGCALSLGCRDANGPVLRMEMVKTVAYLYYAEKVVRYKTDQKTTNAIAQFDETHDMPLGLYRLHAPRGQERLRHAHVGRQGRKNANVERKEITTAWIRGREPR